METGKNNGEHRGLKGYSPARASRKYSSPRP